MCLVTGGAGGLGWALSQALADHGASVYACDISEENLARARAELETSPWRDRIFLSRCDVGDRGAFEGWIARIHQETGRIDVLVNNAAFVRWEDVSRMTVEESERSMRVGYDSMVYGTKAVLPLMSAAGRGAIVNIGSIAGRVFVGSSSAAYSAAKAAIDAYTQILQVELQGSPLHVMLVRPATIAGTDFLGKHVAPTRLPRLADFLPPLTPPEVAMAILRGLRRRSRILDIPAYNSVLHLVFLIAPGFLRWMLTVGGPSRRNFGAVPWKYTPTQHRDES